MTVFLQRILTALFAGLFYSARAAGNGGSNQLAAGSGRKWRSPHPHRGAQHRQNGRPRAGKNNSGWDDSWRQGRGGTGDRGHEEHQLMHIGGRGAAAVDYFRAAPIGGAEPQQRGGGGRITWQPPPPPPAPPLVPYSWVAASSSSLLDQNLLLRQEPPRWNPLDFQVRRSDVASYPAHSGFAAPAGPQDGSDGLAARLQVLRLDRPTRNAPAVSVSEQPDAPAGSVGAVLGVPAPDGEQTAGVGPGQGYTPLQKPVDSAQRSRSQPVTESHDAPTVRWRSAVESHQEEWERRRNAAEQSRKQQIEKQKQVVNAALLPCVEAQAPGSGCLSAEEEAEVLESSFLFYHDLLQERQLPSTVETQLREAVDEQLSEMVTSAAAQLGARATMSGTAAAAAQEIFGSGGPGLTATTGQEERDEEAFRRDLGRKFLSTTKMSVTLDVFGTSWFGAAKIDKDDREDLGACRTTADTASPAPSDGGAGPSPRSSSSTTTATFCASILSVLQKSLREVEELRRRLLDARATGGRIFAAALDASVAAGTSVMPRVLYERWDQGIGERIRHAQQEKQPHDCSRHQSTGGEVGSYSFNRRCCVVPTSGRYRRYYADKLDEAATMDEDDATRAREYWQGMLPSLKLWETNLRRLLASVGADAVAGSGTMAEMTNYEGGDSSSCSSEGRQPYYLIAEGGRVEEEQEDTLRFLTPLRLLQPEKAEPPEMRESVRLVQATTAKKSGERGGDHILGRRPRGDQREPSGSPLRSPSPCNHEWRTGWQLSAGSWNMAAAQEFAHQSHGGNAMSFPATGGRWLPPATQGHDPGIQSQQAAPSHLEAMTIPIRSPRQQLETKEEDEELSAGDADLDAKDEPRRLAKPLLQLHTETSVPAGGRHLDARTAGAASPESLADDTRGHADATPTLTRDSPSPTTNDEKLSDIYNDIDIETNDGVEEDQDEDEDDDVSHDADSTVSLATSHGSSTRSTTTAASSVPSTHAQQERPASKQHTQRKRRQRRAGKDSRGCKGKKSSPSSTSGGANAALDHDAGPFLRENATGSDEEELDPIEAPAVAEGYLNENGIARFVEWLKRVRDRLDVNLTTASHVLRAKRELFLDEHEMKADTVPDKAGGGETAAAAPAPPVAPAPHVPGFIGGGCLAPARMRELSSLLELLIQYQRFVQEAYDTCKSWHQRKKDAGLKESCKKAYAMMKAFHKTELSNGEQNRAREICTFVEEKMLEQLRTANEPRMFGPTGGRFQGTHDGSLCSAGNNYGAGAASSGSAGSSGSDGAHPQPLTGEILPALDVRAAAEAPEIVAEKQGSAMGEGHEDGGTPTSTASGAVPAAAAASSVAASDSRPAAKLTGEVMRFEKEFSPYLAPKIRTRVIRRVAAREHLRQMTLSRQRGGVARRGRPGGKRKEDPFLQQQLGQIEEHANLQAELRELAEVKKGKREATGSGAAYTVSGRLVEQHLAQLPTGLPFLFDDAVPLVMEHVVRTEKLYLPLVRLHLLPQVLGSEVGLLKQTKMAMFFKNLVKYLMQWTQQAKEWLDGLAEVVKLVMVDEDLEQDLLEAEREGHLAFVVQEAGAAAAGDVPGDARSGTAQQDEAELPSLKQKGQKPRNGATAKTSATAAEGGGASLSRLEKLKRIDDQKVLRGLDMSLLRTMGVILPVELAEQLAEFAQESQVSASAFGYSIFEKIDRLRLLLIGSGSGSGSAEVAPDSAAEGEDGQQTLISKRKSKKGERRDRRNKSGASPGLGREASSAGKCSRPAERIRAGKRVLVQTTMVVQPPALLAARPAAGDAGESVQQQVTPEPYQTGRVVARAQSQSTGSCGAQSGMSVWQVAFEGFGEDNKIMRVDERILLELDEGNPEETRVAPQLLDP